MCDRMKKTYRTILGEGENIAELQRLVLKLIEQVPRLDLIVVKEE